MTITNLPTDSDLAECSFQWAVRLLGETPTRLRVSPIDAGLAPLFREVAVEVDPSLSCCAWILEGTDRAIYSGGG